jgi:hypothetical protein
LFSVWLVFNAVKATIKVSLECPGRIGAEVAWNYFAANPFAFSSSYFNRTGCGFKVSSLRAVTLRFVGVLLNQKARAVKVHYVAGFELVDAFSLHGVLLVLSGSSTMPIGSLPVNSDILNQSGLKGKGCPMYKMPVFFVCTRARGILSVAKQYEIDKETDKRRARPSANGSRLY